jgi:hypothetical protein
MAAVGDGEAFEDFHRGCFAGTVGSKQAEAFAAGYFQIQMVDGYEVAIALYKLPAFYGQFRHHPPLPGDRVPINIVAHGLRSRCFVWEKASGFRLEGDGEGEGKGKGKGEGEGEGRGEGLVADVEGVLAGG